MSRYRLEFVKQVAAFILLLLTVATAAAESPAGKLWLELEAKRKALPGAHQEFDVSRSGRHAMGGMYSQHEIAVDLCGRQWRESSGSGAVRIFDGKELFSLEGGGDEFVRAKLVPKDGAPAPAPYSFGNAYWPQASERERRPCGFKTDDHECVIINVPLQPKMRGNFRIQRSTATLALDTTTGLLISMSTVETLEANGGGHELESRAIMQTVYTTKRMSWGEAPDASLFALPAGMHEVRSFSPWNAAKINKQLAGKPAPELEVVDLDRRRFTIAALRGRTVLLDFWTTWCPPCQADAPALDKLYRKYGAHDLMIVGISVDEERRVVAQFLQSHPHVFPTVLTSENEMPPPYRVSALPTYIVIDRSGNVSSATEGDRGFAELATLLKKAGLEPD